MPNGIYGTCCFLTHTPPSLALSQIPNTFILCFVSFLFVFSSLDIILMFIWCTGTCMCTPKNKKNKIFLHTRRHPEMEYVNKFWRVLEIDIVKIGLKQQWMMYMYFKIYNPEWLLEFVCFMCVDQNYWMRFLVTGLCRHPSR